MEYRPHGSAYIRGVCLVAGCNGKQSYKGKDKSGRRYYGKYCNVHRKSGEHFSSHILNLNGTKSIENGKCSLCGWNKGPCDRHRIIPEKGYVPENVVVLCPNCHRLVSLKIISL